MKLSKLSFLAALPVLLVTPTALARSHHQNHNPKPPTSHPTPAPVPPPAPTPPPTPPSGTTTVKSVTFYGWPDNSPPGTAIAYPQIHKGAGGVGTFTDPVTFATSSKLFAPGTKLYVPFLSKYVIMEDNCVDCVSDYNKGITHIDIWLNSNASFKKETLACENKWTPDGSVSIVQNPASNLTVNTTPLFNTSTGKCL